MSQFYSTSEALKTLVDLDFEHTSLDNVLAYLNEVVPELNITIDPQIPVYGVDLSTRVVDLKVKAVSVAAILRLILGADLGYRVEHNYVLITTVDRLQRSLPVRTLDVADIVSKICEGVRDPQEAAGMLVDVVKRALNNMSDPDVAVWADEGGPGSVDFINGKLVVTQTEHALGKLLGLLEDLRQGNGAAIQEPRDDAMKEPPKVFVVHGRDLGAKEEVARFLEKLGLSTVVIAERGRGTETLVESIERGASAADFAVVVLTPDDLGIAKKNFDGAKTDAAKVALLKPRARQNVVFELGYLMGVLGRARVCALRKGGLELFSELSDMHGVFCPEMDVGGGWKNKIAQALKIAGFDVDMNRLAR